MGGDKTNENSKEGIMREKRLFLLSSFKQSVVYLEQEDASGVKLVIEVLKMEKELRLHLFCLILNSLVQSPDLVPSHSHASMLIHLHALLWS